MPAAFSDETVVRILELAFPPPTLADGDPWRRRVFLLDCRLVSKQWDRVAQRIRFEHLCLLDGEVTPEEEEVLAGGSEGVGRYVRTVESESGTLERAEKLLESTLEVRRVFAQDDEEKRTVISASVLDSLDELQHLHLDTVTVSDYLLPCSLTVLSLTDVAFHPAPLFDLHLPSSTPELRALFLSNISRADDPEAMDGELDQPLVPEVLARPKSDVSRLEVFQIGCSDGFVEAPRPLFRRGPPILVSFDPTGASRLPQVMGSGYPPSEDSEEEYGEYDPHCHEPPWLDVAPSAWKLPPHLYLMFDSSPLPYPYFRDPLQSLCDLISRTSPDLPIPLKSVFLSRPPPPSNPSTAPSLQSLFGVCAERGIEVHFTPPQERETLCREFWGWANERRAAGGETGAGYASTSEEDESQGIEEEEEDDEGEVD
ncbi:hypothetical protein JCM6882_004431 [Rhodosporidiobolus microsporus]